MSDDFHDGVDEVLSAFTDSEKFDLLCEWFEDKYILTDEAAVPEVTKSAGKVYLRWLKAGADYYTKSDNYSIVRHPSNIAGRLAASKKMKLCASVLQRGIVLGVRGESWIQWSRRHTLPFLAISWGNLTVAFYEVLAK